MTPYEKMPDRSPLRKETHSLTHSFMGVQSTLVKGVPSGGFQLWWQEQITPPTVLVLGTCCAPQKAS